MRLIDADALRATLEGWATSHNADPHEYTIVQGAFDVLDAAEPVCCERCARYDVTSFCSRWERCPHHDDGCSYFIRREAT